MTIGTQGPRETRLSVVVPCYKVEDYLDATLDSIQRQSYRNLEIIVVDDGSPDRSGAIARAHARRDRRIKVITQPNAGLGAARNTGLRRATGDFIAFADSDDTIPQGAYARMMGSLAQTGSDFVVGNVERRYGASRWVPMWAQEVHARDLRKITLGDLPIVLQDVFAWNKVFRRDFFLKSVREFPEGIRYEDQAPTARAYTASRSFDVISDVVYTWVIRDDGTSITQGKARIGDLHDRLEVKRSVAAILRDRAPQHVYEYWLAKAIGFDLESYFVQIPRTDEDYWQTLRSGVARLAENLDEASWDQVKFNDRVKVACALEGTSADVEAVVTTLEETSDGFALAPTEQGVEVTADYVRELGFSLPDKVKRARPADFQPRAKLLECHWAGAGVLEFTCQAMYMGLPGTVDDGGLSVEVVDSSGAVVVAVEAERARITNANEIAWDAYADHEHDVFRARLDLSALASAPQEVGDSRWRVMVRRSTPIGEFRSHLTHRSVLSTAATFPHGPLVDGERLALRWDLGLGLAINRPKPHAVATRLTLSGRRMELTVEEGSSPHRGKAIQDLTVWHKWSGERINVAPQASGRGAATFVVDLPALSERYLKGVQRWRMKLRYEDGASELLQFSGGDFELFAHASQGARVSPSLTPNGFLQLDETEIGGYIASARLNEAGDALDVVGELSLPDGVAGVELALVSQRGIQLDASDVELGSGPLHASIPLTRGDATGGDAVELAPLGGYSVRVRTVSSVSGDTQKSPWRWLPVSPELTDHLPQYFSGERSEIRLSRTEKAKSLWLNLYAPQGGIERGKYAARLFQQQLEAEAPQLEDAILFESYGGRNCTDAPLMIARELQRRGDTRPQYFAIHDHSVRAPEGTTAVVIGSAQYRRLLHSCRWLVNNNNFPFYFRKREGQRYIQTWHGTPLKRIGNDVPSVSLSLSYRRLMQREAGYWDVLLSQNEYAAGIFPRAFDYRGDVLTLGYPRNDELFAEDAAEHRSRLRSELGISDATRALLYAPTWRDNVKASSGAYAMVSHLDPDALEAKLGRDFVVLQRGHSNTAASVKAQDDPRIIDVTSHPDLNGLFLASDALVTDYSSVFFDYADTGKPIVFLVPDLEEYAGSTRGFYVDLAEIAPGPLCRDSAEVATWLVNPDRLRTQWASAYAAFTERFTPLDGPDTAGAVVDAVM